MPTLWRSGENAGVVQLPRVRGRTRVAIKQVRILSGQANKKEVNKLKEEKLEQLKTIFKSTAKKVFDDGYDNTIRLKDTDKYFNVVAEQLAYEVKIRINNK